MLTSVVVLATIAAAVGVGLSVLARKSPQDDDALSARINALLPQTQCAQCGYPGCGPYAEAIAVGQCDINRCPPGGPETIAALAHLLGSEAMPIATDVPATAPPQVAYIDEQECIGCTLCLAPCPVDAIVGAQRMMHTVLIAECTGCELCVAPCPVDCISMLASNTTADLWTHKC